MRTEICDPDQICCNPGQNGKIETPENLQRKIKEIRLLDISNVEEITAYLSILNSENNRIHLAGFPKTIEEVREKSADPSDHILIGINGVNEVIATATVDDASPKEADNFINRLAVREDLQRTTPRPEGDKSKGVGRQMLEGVLEWGFTTSQADGRERRAMHLAIAMFIPKWEAMYNLATHTGFISGAIWPNNFIKEDGSTVDMVRLYILREWWERNVIEGTYAITD